MTGHNGPTRGAIGVIDRRRGDNAQASIENITPDVPVPGVAEGNGNTSGSKPYSSPFPLDTTRFLVSARGPVLVRTLDGECQALAWPAPPDGITFKPQTCPPQGPPPPLPLAPPTAEVPASPGAPASPAAPASPGWATSPHTPVPHGAPALPPAGSMTLPQTCPPHGPLLLPANPPAPAPAFALGLGVAPVPEQAVSAAADARAPDAKDNNK